MRVLGLDYGSRRIGVALGDTESKIASPWGVITYDDRLDVLVRLHDIAKRDLVDAIVIGVPHLTSDAKKETAQMHEAREFIQDVQRWGLPVHEEDETLTTKLAATHMRERGEKGKRDDLAAAAILQGWLERNS